MNPLLRLAEWFDVRPNEIRPVALSFFGAFLVIGFLILSKSLREAFYLTLFDVTTLPYITAAVAVTSVPTIGLFSRLMAQHDPMRVLNATLAVESVGLIVLWRMADRAAPAAVLFYLWTSIGALLLTSGFWIVTAERFSLRDAKRLFGLVGAGGTVGALLLGNALAWASPRMTTLVPLVPALVGLLLLLFITQALPRRQVAQFPRTTEDDVEPPTIAESIALVLRSPHLRTVALIVFTATAASTLLDFQFKDLAQQRLTTLPATEGGARQLASFFGAFYGWTGGIALALQLLFTSRLMSRYGVAGTIGVLPAVFLLGAAGFLLLPTLAMVTLARGGAYTVRKSLYRSGLEVLYVPLPAVARRKTKPFIDSTVDAVADACAAGVIFLLVTLLGLSSRYLSAIIAAAAICLLLLSRRAGREYFRTLTGRLVAERGRSGEDGVDTTFDRRDLLSASFTHLDLRTLAEELGEPRPRRGAGIDDASGDGPERPSPVEAPNVDVLLRSLARDSRYHDAVEGLVELGDEAEGALVAALADPATDFVIRRRLPAVLARVGGPTADDALLDALTATRFEVRYRAALALVWRRKRGLPASRRDAASIVWEAIRRETGRDRPVWELQRLLDRTVEGDELVSGRVGVRGQLSLEHAFRLLSLVLEPSHVRSAFQGILVRDGPLRNFALEYLEHVLPTDVRERLWPFIGDQSEYRRERQIRSIDHVVADLMETGATLFGTEESREALRRMLEDSEPNDE